MDVVNSEVSLLCVRVSELEVKVGELSRSVRDLVSMSEGLCRDIERLLVVIKSLDRVRDSQLEELIVAAKVGDIGWFSDSKKSGDDLNIF